MHPSAVRPEFPVSVKQRSSDLRIIRAFVENVNLRSEGKHLSCTRCSLKSSDLGHCVKLEQGGWLDYPKSCEVYDQQFGKMMREAHMLR